MSETTVFAAKKIITMDRNRTEATHVAVRDGHILAVGGPNCADPWGGGRADDRLADAVLMPGFVEGHAHMTAGAIWNYAYAGGVDVYQYEQGSLMLDIVDAGTHQLVWRGSAQAEIDQYAKDEKKDKLLNDAVGGMLAKFPPGGK